MKTDKELVFDTLLFLKNKPSQNLPETFWKEINTETQIRIKDILWKNQFINFENNQPFIFGITTAGYFAKENDLDKDGFVITNYDRLIERITLLGIIPIFYSVIEIIKAAYDFWNWICQCH